MAPLTYLTGYVPFFWGETQQAAFEKVKGLIISAPVLAHPDFEKSFVPETNTSNFAPGSVILQVGEDRLKLPFFLQPEDVDSREKLPILRQRTPRHHDRS